ncbi:hypothetical protein ACFQAT_11055 [Undibacterium arcticum]|uniref:Uncharacterized protein n=1 Tax=Undibacterium arcticum TaxID=1762892 RepID=A0ABV7F155_9BURK
MDKAFWLQRFFLVTKLVFAVLMVGELMKGHAVDVALWNSLVWSLLSSAIYTGASVYKLHPDETRALCRDVFTD